jgi:hypothetical protein
VEPRIAWESSDRLLSGSTLAVRAVGLPDEDVLRAAVAISLHVPPGSTQVADDGSAVVTVLLGPAEALGASAWLRNASLAAEEIGPPLFDFEG